MRLSPAFEKKTSKQLLPFIDVNPALLSIPNVVLDIAMDEIVADTPFSNPVTVTYLFLVLGVFQAFKGNHNGVAPTEAPVLILDEV